MKYTWKNNRSWTYLERIHGPRAREKVLILVPASLVSQWAYELNTKFFIPAVAQKKSYSWEQADVIVSSIDTAKRSPHRDIVLNLEYDLIIIDEAHKLKNNKTKL